MTIEETGQVPDGCLAVIAHPNGTAELLVPLEDPEANVPALWMLIIYIMQVKIHDEAWGRALLDEAGIALPPTNERMN